MNKLLKKIINFNENFSNINSLSIVGSYNLADKDYNDIDILITYTGDLKNILEELKGYGNYTIIDDSIRLKIDNIEFGLVYKKEDIFIDYIQSIINGEKKYRINKNWAAGGYIPEVLLNDINKSNIIFDRSGKIDKIYKSLKIFPITFKRKLIYELKSEINIKSNLYTKTDGFFKNILLTDLQIATLRYLYVNNNLFFPGIKHINTNDFNKGVEKEIVKNILINNIININNINNLLFY